MKKILFPIIGFLLLCLSYTQTGNKRLANKRIDDRSSERLILKPFNLFGLLWSCSPDDEPNSYSYEKNNEGGSGGEGGSSGGSGGGDSSYHTSHSSHYSQYHSSHSSHYSGSHQSHRSHQSHSSHYSAH